MKKPDANKGLVMDIYRDRIGYLNWLAGERLLRRDEATELKRCEKALAQLESEVKAITSVPGENDRKEVGMAFHLKDGWYFQRLEPEGKVRIYHEEGVKQAESKFSAYDVCLEIDADSWASIIASVSARGDTAEAFQEAKRLHSLEKQEIKPSDVGKVEDIL